MCIDGGIFKISNDSYSEIVNTSSSPFKVSLIQPEMDSSQTNTLIVLKKPQVTSDTVLGI